MGKLSGVQKLEFDCKTATITMKEGVSLSKEAATDALVKAGFGVTKIEGGEAPKVTAYVFRVTGVDLAAPVSARKALQDALDATDYVSVDATGAAAVTLRGDERTTETALADALRRAGFGMEGFAVHEWPRTPAIYVVDLKDVEDVAAATRARDGLVALEKVLWAEMHPAEKSATIFLNEPCAEIEGKVREALAGLGYGVTGFRLAKS